MQRLFPSIKKRIRRIVKFVAYKWVLPATFKLYSRKPIDEKLVVFADHRDREMPDNFCGLYDMCMAKEFNCVVLSGKSFGKSVPIWKRRMAKIRFHFEFMRLYARCRAVFLYDTFHLAYIAAPRAGTDVIQLWHGCGLMKTMSYAAIETNWSKSMLSQRELKVYPIHTSYTLVCVSSPVVGKGYEKAFRCDPSIIQPIGCPRTDIYFDEKFREAARKKVRAMLPNIGKRKIVLYAPTYRGTSIAKSHMETGLNYKALKERLSEQYVLLLKFHPLMAKGGFPESARIQAGDFAFDVSKKLSPEEALCAADVLITDYSSIVFEYMLLERPIVSYIPDLDQYIADRGFFHPYDELVPGPYTFTQEELTEKLLTVSQWFDIKRLRSYKERYMSACDGHSTERIYRYIFEK